MNFLILFALVFRITQQEGVGNSKSQECDDCGTIFGVVFGTIFPVTGLILFLTFYCLCIKLKKKRRDLILNDLKLENDSTPENLKYGLEILQRCNWALSQSSNLWLQLQAQDQNVQLNYNQKLDKHFIEINLKKTWCILQWARYSQQISLDQIDIFSYKFYQNVWKIYLIQSQRCRYVQRSCCKLSIVVLEGTSNNLLEGFKGRWYECLILLNFIQQMSKISLEYGVGDLCHQIKYCDNQYFIEMLKFKYIIFSNIMLDWSTFSQSFSNEEKKNNKIRIKRAQFINIYSSEAYVFTSKESILYY